MREILFISCILAVTVYLAVTAWEDYKTCEVTRWKHLVGGIPALLYFFLNCNRYSIEENIAVIFFAVLYTVVGYAGIYGFADGLVLGILTLFFGSIGGPWGSGAVVLIMVIAAFSFFSCHVVKSVVKHKKIFVNMAGALIPHICVGYVVVLLIVALYG